MALPSYFMEQKRMPDEFLNAVISSYEWMYDSLKTASVSADYSPELNKTKEILDLLKMYKDGCILTQADMELVINTINEASSLLKDK